LYSYSDVMTDTGKLPIYGILTIQLNALWISEINERLSDLKSMFRTSRIFRDELEICGDTFLTTESFGLFPSSSKKIGEEDRMLAWYNSVCQLLGLLESILTQLKVTPRYQSESNSSTSFLKAGTSTQFKGWLQNEIEEAGYDTDSCPQSSLCMEQFESTLSQYIQDFSLTTARLYGRDELTIVRKGPKHRTKEPYHYLNEALLEKIIPILLKVRPLLDKTDDSADFDSDFDSGKIGTVTLADIFQSHLVGSDWLKDHLGDIEIRLPYYLFNPTSAMTLPDWLPNIEGLYSLIIVIMMRYPTSLAKHVLGKFAEFGKKNSDNSNFIAEMRPVLEECTISTFCAETLNLSVSPSNLAVLDSIETMRKVFRELLQTYITKVLLPEKDWLGNDKFDRSQFLSRVNSMGIVAYNSKQYETGTIGSFLKYELYRLKTMCKKMQISSTPFLCYNFSHVIVDLLSVITTWFENRLINQFHQKLKDFLQVTDNMSQVDTNKIRQNILESLMITLRTNTNLFIDKEAHKVFRVYVSGNKKIRHIGNVIRKMVLEGQRGHQGAPQKLM